MGLFDFLLGDNSEKYEYDNVLSHLPLDIEQNFVNKITIPNVLNEIIAVEIVLVTIFIIEKLYLDKYNNMPSAAKKALKNIAKKYSMPKLAKFNNFREIEYNAGVQARLASYQGDFRQAMSGRLFINYGQYSYYDRALLYSTSSFYYIALADNLALYRSYSPFATTSEIFQVLNSIRYQDEIQYGDRDASIKQYFDLLLELFDYCNRYVQRIYSLS